MIYKCANCGKEFNVLGEQWGYAYGVDKTCSYHCMREMRRQDLYGEEKPKPMKKGTKCHLLTEDEKALIRQLRESGLTYRQIANRMEGVNEKSISSYCHRMAIKSPVNNMGKRIGAELPDLPNIEPIIEQIEAVEKEAGQEKVDLSRLINTLCDAVALLKKLYDRIADENGV